MNYLEAPYRLFDLPHRMSRSFVEELVSDLSERFTTQYGRPPSDPAADLQVMREALFDPVAREERLRRQLDSLRPTLAWDPPEGTPATLALDIGGGAWLLTPEGRVAIPSLGAALAGQKADQVEIDELDISAAEHLLADTYRQWTRYRLQRVLTLREGQDRPMLPAAIATALFLLVNGNVGAEWALVQPKDEETRERLDAAVTLPVQKFAEGIAPRDRASSADRRHLQLYNGYGLSEARRRLGSNLVLERDPDSEGRSKRLYIEPGTEPRIVEALARELKARGVAREDLASAFDQMIEAYEGQRPQIAAFGVTNARPSWTRQLRKELLQGQ